MDNGRGRLSPPLPYGQQMVNPDQLAIEIRYVTLPAHELDERRARLRALLVRAALRLARKDLTALRTEAGPVEVIQK